MQFKNTPNRAVILDDQEQWISRSVSVTPAIFFVIGDQVTEDTAFVPLGQRGTDMPDEQGKWGLPGGYLDFDETTGETVIRESWEELGLNIPELQTQFRFRGSLDQPHYVFSQPIRRQNVNLRYPLMFFLTQQADLPPLNPQVSQGEVVEARWFLLKDALAMDLAFEHQVVMRQCLELYYSDIWAG